MNPHQNEFFLQISSIQMLKMGCPVKDAQKTPKARQKSLVCKQIFQVQMFSKPNLINMSNGNQRDNNLSTILKHIQLNQQDLRPQIIASTSPQICQNPAQLSLKQSMSYVDLSPWKFLVKL